MSIKNSFRKSGGFLTFVLIFIFLLPKTAVFARQEWGDNDIGFPDLSRQKITFQLYGFFKEDHIASLDYITSSYFETTSLDFNQYVDRKGLSFVESKRVNPLNLIAALMTYANDKDNNVRISTEIREDTTSNNPVTIYIDGNLEEIDMKEVEAGHFEIPKSWKFYVGDADIQAMEYKFRNDWANPPYDIRPNNSGEPILITAHYLLKEDDDLFVDDRYTYKHGDAEAKEQKSESESKKPEEEKKEVQKTPPTRIPETGPRAGGGFSFYAKNKEILSEAKDPNFVKVIIVDAESLELFELSNSFLPRSHNIEALLYSMYESELAKGKLADYSLLKILSLEEAAAEPELHRLMCEKNADYAILLSH